MSQIYYPHRHYDFVASDLSLLESGRFADVKVTCGEKTWNLHKNIICARCDWFNKAFCGEFLEAETGTVNITEFSPNEVDVLIHYLYTGAILGNKRIRSKYDSTVGNYVQLWVVADFFLAESLKKDVLSRLKDHLADNQRHLFESVRDESLKPKDYVRMVKRYIKELSHGVSATYKDWPHAKPCREAIVNFAHACTLIFSGKEEFVQLARDFRDFSSDMYIAISAGNNKEMITPWRALEGLRGHGI